MCFEIAHDSMFRGMFTETNNFGLRQKKTTRRRHRIYETIRKQYLALADGSENSIPRSETSVIRKQHQIRKMKTIFKFHAKGKN